MIGEPILVMLVEDNIDHAELVIRTLEEHRIANKVRHSWMANQRSIIFFGGESFLMLQEKHRAPMLFYWIFVCRA
jgi:hypothetical protein